MEDPQSNKIRLLAFDWLAKQVAIHGDVLPRELLSRGFDFEGERIPFVAPQGIFKPRLIQHYPLTITTIPGGPYSDRLVGDKLIEYRYRGSNPNHPDNVRLRDAMKDEIPMIYLHRVTKGYYLVHWPVFVVGDNPGALTFTVEAAPLNMKFYESDIKLEIQQVLEKKIERRYVTTQVVQRIHQRSFRESVITAYREHCAICRLKHRELLDAAHIIPDSEGGEPVVQNGLSLCKIHHAAFDNNILGISPDYQVRIREDILAEVDGPMLKWGLQEMNGVKLYLPISHNRPNRDWLDERFRRFVG